MKKLTLMLVIMFVISTLCIPVSAVEPNPNAVVVADSDIHDSIMEIAILAFPEYEHKIRGQHLSNQTVNTTSISDGSMPSVIESETRQLSDTTVVSYQEYDNGIALTSVGTVVGKNVTDVYSEVTHTTTTMNIWLQLSGSSQTLCVYNVQYTFLTNGYGAVNNTGSIPSISTARSPRIYHLTPLGSASGPAVLQYEAIFDTYIGMPSGDNALLYYAGYLTLKVYPDSIELLGSFAPQS